MLRTQLYSQGKESELGIFSKKHTNTYWKKLQAPVNKKIKLFIKKICWKSIFYEMKLNNNYKNKNNSKMKDNSKKSSDGTEKENSSR